MKARRRATDPPDSSSASGATETGGRADSDPGPATWTESARLLVIEDEPDLLELLRYNLTRQHYEVTCTERGERGLELARQERPDLVLLDLMLPGMDGLEVCRALRDDPATAHLPVLMLTARDQESDIVRGLEIGADDYVTKPYRWAELLARIRAVLRRASVPTEASDEQSHVIRVRDLVIDAERYRVTVGDAPVELTATEFKLLHMLASQPGRVFTRGQIIQAVHGELAAITERAVDVQIVALRRKLAAAAGEGASEDQQIETIRGVGYRFRE